MTRQPFMLPALVAMSWLASAAALAQHEADDAHVHYTVQAGDNLSTLAQRHLQDFSDLAEVVRVNQIRNIHRHKPPSARSTAPRPCAWMARSRKTSSLAAP